MRDPKRLQRRLGLVLITLIALSVVGCGTQQTERNCEATEEIDLYRSEGSMGG